MRIQRPAIERDSGPVLRAKIRKAVAKSKLESRAGKTQEEADPSSAPGSTATSNSVKGQKGRSQERLGDEFFSGDRFISSPYRREIQEGHARMLKGHRGEAVRELQTQLNAENKDLEPDGRFGPLTESAVRKFQNDNGLLVTGRVDALTLRILMKKPNPVKFHP